MKNLTLMFLWIVLAFNLVNAYYLQGYPQLFSDGRIIRLSPKSSVWRQKPPQESDVNPYLRIERDQFPAASEHESYHNHGRVQIKVYRGPDDHHDDFAPYGFWIKQPADDGY